MQTIGSVLEPYSMTKKHKFYGFGSLNLKMSCSSLKRMDSQYFGGKAATAEMNIFPISGDAEEPASVGMEDLIANYRKITRDIVPGKECYLAPVLKRLRGLINKRDPNYHVVLLMVSGPIADMSETKERIVMLSRHPCQIIIVGISDIDFSQLEELNADGGKLRDDSNNISVRKMVQFIKLSDALARGDLA